MNMRKVFPILDWLPKYKRQQFRGDLSAGLTVGVMLIPQGMAYALLAGIPPIYGLYASIFPLIIYALMGTSRQLSVGPTALVSLLVLAGLATLEVPEDSEQYITLVIAISAIAGAIQVLLGFLRLGVLVKFLSNAVILGFTFAAAIIIAFSQVKYLFGINVPRSNYLHEIILGVLQNIGELHLPTFLMALGSYLLILGLKKISPRLPGSLIAVVLSIAITAIFHLEEWGITIIKEVPKGLPAFMIPDLTFKDFTLILPLAATICLISFIESLAIAKTIEARHGDYKIDPNQELVALGFAKIGSAFFQSMPTTGSFTRSALNDNLGAKTGLSSIIGALLVAVTLLFFTPWFYYLPNAVLAAVILVAVLGLIEPEKAKALWRSDRRDFAVMAITFFITLFVGIQAGVLAGIILSLIFIIQRSATPHLAELGQIPDTTYYRNVKRFPQAIEDEEILIVRFDAQLYFSNADYFLEQVEELAIQKGEKLKLVILDASGIVDIDTSGLDALQKLMLFFRARDIQFYSAGFIGPVRDRLYRSGLMNKIGGENQFMYIPDAIQYYHLKDSQKREGWSPHAIQSNIPK